jgi:formylglycine-generating enzyme required for sulfatase activity
MYGEILKFTVSGTLHLHEGHYSPVNAEAAKAPKSKMTTFWKYPALDMSHEAAKWYCDWLTFQYNLQSDRKFKRVLFRLPTQQEWTMAALGYKEFTSWNLGENTVTAFTDWGRNKKDLQSFDLKDHTVLYPWWYRNFNFKDRIQNQFDCYLANIKAPETITCPAGVKGDGWTGPAFVGAYFPNEMGLYDMVGNAAEMIDKDGKAMGGSWNHKAEESTIISVNNYTGSEASVGFRLFMEVIEE